MEWNSYYLSAIIALINLLSAGPLLAQKTRDTNYIKLYPDQVTVRMYLGEKISAFDLVDGSKDRMIEYRPNNILGLGLGVTIKGVGLNFSTRLPFHDNKIDRYGRTRRYDLQVHRYRGRFLLDGYAQRYKGFHLNTANDVYSVPGTTIYPYFEDLITLNIGASVMYLFNGDRFSMRGSINQQDRQLRSAGSFMAGASFFARYIFNDEAILPATYKYPDFFEADPMRHIGNYGLVITGGYGYNFIFNKYFFAGASADIGVGPGYSMVKNTAGGELSSLGLTFAGNVRAAVGYNSDKWFGGFYLIAHGDSYSLPYEQSRVNNLQGIIRLVAARRISTKKKAIKSVSENTAEPPVAQ
jgi:hypothetical protein